MMASIKLSIQLLFGIQIINYFFVIKQLLMFKMIGILNLSLVFREKDMLQNILEKGGLEFQRDDVERIYGFSKRSNARK